MKKLIILLLGIVMSCSPKMYSDKRERAVDFIQHVIPGAVIYYPDANYEEELTYFFVYDTTHHVSYEVYLNHGSIGMGIERIIPLNRICCTDKE